MSSLLIEQSSLNPSTGLFFRFNVWPDYPGQPHVGTIRNFSGYTCQASQPVWVHSIRRSIGCADYLASRCSLPFVKNGRTLGACRRVGGSHCAEMRRVILNLHLLVALSAGAFMVILGVTGSIIEFEPELDRLFHPHLSFVIPGRRILALSEMGDAVSQRFGGEPVVAYVPSLSPGLSYQIVLPRGIVYVNQYTGEVLGLRERGQTFLGYMRALHVRLAIGNVGRNIVRWSGAAMVFSLVSGLYLWWPIKQVRIRGDWRSRRFLFDLHNLVGIFSFLVLTLLAATGTVIGFEDQLAPLIHKLTSSAQLQTSHATIPERTPGSLPITPEQAVTIARTQIPGAVPYRVQMPKYGSLYQVALQSPNDGIGSGRNVVALDPFGNLVSVTRSGDLSTGERILEINQALHTGVIVGMPGRLAVTLASAMVTLQVSSGLLLWRRRGGDPLAAGRSTKEETDS
jgi:uncharacterized iron-regulated membrane protein